MKVVEAERVWTIYCEGFHDRDFLAGLLGDVLKWTSLERDSRYRRGKFAFRTAGTDLVTIPCGGKPKAIDAFRAALEAVESERPAALVLCLDEDDARSVEDARKRAHDRIATLVDSDAFNSTTGELKLADGTEVRLLPITWCCADGAASQLPDRQNLERLIVAACCEAYPDRGVAVEQWLASRASPPTDAPSQSKAYSWSHMAGWFPSPGGNEFLRALWRDERIRTALSKRMGDTGIDWVLAAIGVTPPWLPVG